MSSEDDNSRTDEYWMGVRDALRMVDSFHKWSKRNPGRAKSLEDFIHDGLIAAAKRCESCLSDKMGLSFAEEKEADDEITIEDSTELEDEEEEVEIISEESLEIVVVPEEPEPSIEEPVGHVVSETDTPSEDIEESTISLDSVERKEDIPMDDFSIEGPPREFSTDFDLIEPTPLIIDETEIPEAPTIDESEPEQEEVWEEEIEMPSEPESEELPDRPSFTWSEYEKAVSPSSEPEPLDSELDILLPDDEEVSEEIDSEGTEEPPEPPKVWSPYDEPSIQEDSEIEAEVEIDEPTSEVEGEDEPVISEPPSPPPPPESEEDEEERKRRARRLFFGA